MSARPPLSIPGTLDRTCPKIARLTGFGYRAMWACQCRPGYNRSSMRALNRARLLWGYLRGKAKLNALPVEYIVETTAKCNLYCPMCPRETHKQPKEDMADEIFERLVAGAGQSAEHMMLIGLGEPLLDSK